MLIVALTGGIGSGKSTVGEIFANLGAVVVDSDQFARDVVERGTRGFDQIVAEFGDKILKNGSLDRSALASIVFEDQSRRQKLEQIIHPLIRQEFAKVIESARKDTIIIYQIPLLVESKSDYKFDYIITVSSKQGIRQERLRSRGLSELQIKNRIDAQTSDSQRESIAQTVINNDSTLPDLMTQVEEIWDILLVKNGKK